MIASVFDGDTFRMTDGQVVRVLGIDSCEMTTHSGTQARADALRLLPVGQPVSLRTEPGSTVTGTDATCATSGPPTAWTSGTR